MRSRLLFALAVFALLASPGLASPGLAQSPPGGAPTRIRGTVEKLDGRDLTVKSRDGDTVSVTLAPNFLVLAVVPKTMADIKPGDTVASTSLHGSDGKLMAVEVHIFPRSMRVAEGQFPWDLVPGSLMTNATVAQVAKVPRGQVMTVTYQGHRSAITVLPGIPIVGYVPGDASLLKPGAAVFLIARKNPDGGLTAARVTAEKNGVKPPM
ncbi:MAG TPA: hypothetical protein VGM07_03145 [Stellaceae bacterium]|jgi:hypothetical protein